MEESEITEEIVRTTPIRCFTRSSMVEERSLGRGGQAEVFLCTAPFYGKVAVKKFGTDEGSWKYTKRELLASLNLSYHPNILGFFGFFYNEEPSSQRQNGYVMEYMKGGSLMDVVLTSRETYSFLDVLNWIRQAALGLAFIHHNGIIHRDVNPNNMLLSYDRKTLKISDLGLACDIDREKKTAEVGTMGFRSPEVMHGGEYGFKNDVYGFGITVWVVFNRRIPWSSLTNPMVLQSRVINDHWRPPFEELGNFQMDPDDREAMEDLLRSCWHPIQEERPTMKAVLDFLEEFCVAQGMERTISSELDEEDVSVHF